MAGHSHWKQIKQQKGSADQKRGALFSKLLRAISAAAREEQNPEFNPTLRTTIEKARAANVPQENIERAIGRGTRGEETLERLTVEAYGPEGIAVIIEAITDSKNRTLMEVKNILKDHGAKFAEQGSVQWAFSSETASGTREWKPKFPQSISPEGGNALRALVEALEANEDVQGVTTNAAL